MKQLFLILFFCSAAFLLIAQPVTGVWRGKMSSGKGMFSNSINVELKLVKNGDSLVGTAYYFMNANNFIRYSVKGYLDNRDRSVHWWDDKLLGVKPPGTKTVVLFDDAMESDAAFNCPNPNVMKLEGTSHIGEEGPEFVLHFDKIKKTIFPDEWDNVIMGYFTGMSDPGIIDSVFAIAKEYKPIVPGTVTAKADAPMDDKKDKVVIASTTGVNTTPGSNTIAKEEIPVEKAVTQSSIIPVKTELPAEKPASPPIVINEKKEKPGFDTTATVAGSTPAMKQPDSTAVAKQKSVADTNKPAAPPVVAKTSPVIASSTVAKTTSPPVAKQPSETAGTAVKKTEPDVAKPQPAVVKQAVPPASSTSIAKTPTVVKPASDTQVIARSTVSKVPGEDAALTASMRTTTSKAPVVIKPLAIPERVDPVAVQKFVTRKKIDQGEIPMVGDSVELNFYDNAEIDGDSISLFLNGKLLFNHVLLSAQAYTFRLGVKDLPDGSELTMVAENLGSIPPNTAYMMAVVNGQQYSARIESTEHSSGVIKLVRR